MAYLVVDLADNEFISNDKPKRSGHRKSDDFNIYFKYYEEDDLVVGTNYDSGERFIGDFKDLTNWEFEVLDDVVSLPQGTVKKLIGQDLHWEDNPFKVDGVDAMDWSEVEGCVLIQ